MSYFSFNIHDLIQKLVTKMKLINRASKWCQKETHGFVRLDFTSKLVKMLILGDWQETWIAYKQMMFCYSVSLIYIIQKENRWPFWSCWSGLSIAAKQRLKVLFVWILLQKEKECWFSEIKKDCVEVSCFKMVWYTFHRHALTDSTGF